MCRPILILPQPSWAVKASQALHTIRKMCSKHQGKVKSYMPTSVDRPGSDTCGRVCGEHLTVSPGLRIEPRSRDGIDLINEDDGRGVLLCKAEYISHEARALPKVLLYKL